MIQLPASRFRMPDERSSGGEAWKIEAACDLLDGIVEDWSRAYRRLIERVHRVRVVLNAMLSWEEDVRSLCPQAALAEVRRGYIGATACVVQGVRRLSAGWRETASEHPGGAAAKDDVVLGVPHGMTAAGASLREKVRLRASVNSLLNLVIWAAVLFIVYTVWQPGG
jgi:hypothetical protein